MSSKIRDIIDSRILVLDGAMGTMIQRYGLQEEDFRGEELSSHPIKVAGNNDLLALYRPDVISAIHRQYLDSGADIIETCTFNAQSISQSDYSTSHLVRRINLEAARLARAEADRATILTPDKPRFVAGSIGPTSKTASMSPDVENPALRVIDFDQLQSAYEEQIEALIEGGVDLLLIETIFDTLNAKAAIEAAHCVFERKGYSLPIMLSITIADLSGRMLAGQTIEAFLRSMSSPHILSVGLNCSFGAEQMLPLLKEMSAISPYYVSAYPNAGIPDVMGNYDQSPEVMGGLIERFVDSEIVNIVGGCCGTTPDHIRAIADVVAKPHKVHRPATCRKGWLSGIDLFSENGAFINVGERCNVAGSRKFLRLIKEKAYDEALAIARSQVRAGAMILDINMDDGMLDTRTELCNFLNLMASDPEIARLPWMVDSSRFDVIEAALKCIQGKAIVNSLSLKEGEEIFLERALRMKRLGAALVVMAFDEQGQATTFERKVEVCQRAYNLLRDKIDFPTEDIIFDPNILTIATGMREHDSYALDFIRATEWIHANLPHAKVSGGVSNLSFSLRGNNYLREAMHAVFLYHAIRAGMDMAIVNPSTAVMYGDIPSDLLEALEDVILCRREDATERLIAIAEQYREAASEATDSAPTADRKSISIEERLTTALQRGDEEYLEQDLNEALTIYPSAAAIIEGPLMQGMSLVGELFGQGKMFLPQVVKTARTMKRAVSILQPHIEAAATASSSKNGRFLLATVKGDVHDIGKNIAAVVLACNNFEVIDLGVMVAAETIVQKAIEHKADYIGLSGLITPSLDEMCYVAKELKSAGINIPLFIGGATTSALHTAVKIAPLYDGVVLHTKDASQNPVLAMQLKSDAGEELIAKTRQSQEQLRQQLKAEQEGKPATANTEATRIDIDWSKENIIKPTFTGVRTIDHIAINDVRQYINWHHFFNLWRVSSDSAEASKLQAEAEAMLDELQCKHHMLARVGFFEAYGADDKIIIEHNTGCKCCHKGKHQVIIPTPRQSHEGEDGVRLALCDFVAPKGYQDHIGLFATTVSASFAAELEQLKGEGKEYESLMMQSLGDRLVEATSEWLHRSVRCELWGYAPNEELSAKELFAAKYQGIRPAVGYPSLPEQKNIFTLAQLIDPAEIGISLTENGAMYPQASICGLYIASRHARYFVVE
ncbi:MAG: methionine synthase [Alistipes sp.]|nr:methionine synthase [Alistipes sp.]